MAQWLDENTPALKDKTILYLCMEMLIPELNEDCRQANFKGGLGILAGDTMEGLKNLGLNIVAIIPIYNSRWVQNIENNYQKINIKHVDYIGEPITEVTDVNGEHIILDIPFEGVSYSIKVYKIMRADVPVYLLYNEEVFNVLYNNDRKQRMLQEVIVGKSVPKLMDAIGLHIDFIHLNEAHTITAACYIKELEKYNNIPILFTTHTPVPAGMEKYPADWFRYMDLPEKYKELFIRNHNDSQIDFTLGALKISSLTNAVSLEHAEVTRNMFLPYRNKIMGIINGSSLHWQAPELRDNSEVTPEKLWDVHIKYKKLALKDASSRLKKALNMTIEFDLNKPTVGLFRRIVDYKQQYPIFKDIIHAVCGPRGEIIQTPCGELTGLGLQVFIAGYAHPTDEERKEWIHQFMEWTVSEDLRGKFAFLPEYGEALLMHGAHGYDIWVSCPIKDMEACGTSDQRAALNGNLNIASASGGPREYLTEIDPKKGIGSGMFLDPYSPGTLYRKLEIASNLIYSCINGENDTYKKIMLNAYNAGMSVSIDKMAKTYAQHFYLPALEMVK